MTDIQSVFQLEHTEWPGQFYPNMRNANVMLNHSCQSIDSLLLSWYMLYTLTRKSAKHKRAHILLGTYMLPLCMKWLVGHLRKWREKYTGEIIPWYGVYKKRILPMMTSSNGNFFRVTGHLCGEFTGPRWIPRTKASDAELWCFLWSAPE